MKNNGNLLFENVTGSIKLTKNYRLVVKNYKNKTVLAVSPGERK